MNLTRFTSTILPLFLLSTASSLFADAGIREWEWLGPGNAGGRIRAIVVHPTDPNILYVGGLGGGVWKSTNGGNSWFFALHTKLNQLRALLLRRNRYRKNIQDQSKLEDKISSTKTELEVKETSLETLRLCQEQETAKVDEAFQKEPFDFSIIENCLKFEFCYLRFYRLVPIASQNRAVNLTIE